MNIMQTKTSPVSRTAHDVETQMQRAQVIADRRRNSPKAWHARADEQLRSSYEMIISGKFDIEQVAGKLMAAAADYTIGADLIAKKAYRVTLGSNSTQNVQSQQAAVRHTESAQRYVALSQILTQLSKDLPEISTASAIVRAKELRFMLIDYIKIRDRNMQLRVAARIDAAAQQLQSQTESTAQSVKEAAHNSKRA